MFGLLGDGAPALESEEEGLSLATYISLANTMAENESRRITLEETSSVANRSRTQRNH